MPGNPEGAVTSLEAVLDLIPHALVLLSGADPQSNPWGATHETRFIGKWILRYKKFASASSARSASGAPASGLVDFGTLPVPMDPLIATYAWNDRRHAWLYVVMAATGSAVGGLVPFLLAVPEASFPAAPHRPHPFAMLLSDYEYVLLGAVDLVIQVESPPSVASGLQRTGRAGHNVGDVSRGVFFPKYPGDLVQAAVVTQRMHAGEIEQLRMPRNPLDVLAQQIVAMTAMDDWDVSELERVVRRAAPFSGLTRPVLDSVLDMLAGLYPSEDFGGLRPRLVWDRAAGVLHGRPGGQRVAVGNGGTIPDRGLFGVFLAGGQRDKSGRHARRVGELDEEMVYESRVGDVFVLGASSWRIEDITADQVLVSPAPGQPGKLPFWHGDTIGRPGRAGRGHRGLLP